MSEPTVVKRPPFLVAVTPWTARGPGWSNAGVTARYSDGSEKTVYAKDLTAEEHLAHAIGVEVMGVLAKRFGGFPS